jgi:hypothetical protein
MSYIYIHIFNYVYIIISIYIHVYTYIERVQSYNIYMYIYIIDIYVDGYVPSYTYTNITLLYSIYDSKQALRMI